MPSKFDPILIDSPVGFWPLEGGEGAVCLGEAGSDGSIIGNSYVRGDEGTGVYASSLKLTSRISDTRLSTISAYYATFTAECCFNADSLSANQTLMSCGAYYATSVAAFPFSLTLNATGSLTLNLSKGDDYSFDASFSSAAGLVVAGQWYHVGVVVRANGTSEIYLNGVQVASQLTNFYISQGVLPWAWGAPSNPNGGGANTYGFQGKLCGAALFSSALSAAQIARHAALRGTILITGTVRDSDGNFVQRLVRLYNRRSGALTSEAISNPSNGAFSLPASDYSKHCAVVHDTDSLVSYLPFDGANNSTIFTEWSGKPVTPYGDTKISTVQSKIGGASAFFDGTGDYLVMPRSIGTYAAFTVACFVRFNSVSLQQGVWGQYVAGYVGRCGLYLSSTGYLKFFINGLTGGNMEITHSSPCIANQWYHVAVSRDVSGNFNLFVEGVGNAAVQRTGVIDSSMTKLSIGTLLDGVTSPLNGYIDDFLVLDGRCLYSANFTPPAAPQLPAQAKNALIYDLLQPV